MARRVFLPWCCILALVFGASVVLAQEEAPGAADGASAEDLDVSGIDKILRGDQEVMQGDLFSYDPADRKDPFKSLLEGIDVEDEGKGPRPPGLAGMLVEELRVEGINETPSGILAFVQGRDNLS